MFFITKTVISAMKEKNHAVASHAWELDKKCPAAQWENDRVN